MSVNIDTKMITLLGKPLRQSFAARMQNAAYRAAGLNMLYFYTEVENDHLGEVVAGLRQMNFAGFAVTKPNKVAVLQYLDELDPLCEKMGACNTVVKLEDGRLRGYNTDGVGFLTSLRQETALDPRQSSFFCVGAGGAGRAVCSVLAYDGAPHIYIYDACQAAAQQLAADINRNFAPVAQVVDFDDKDAAYARAASCDALLNCSGLGMHTSLDKTPLPQEILRPQQLCFDATYNPAQTLFLRQAQQRGCQTLNGLGMSLYQGVAQIKLWSGQEAPVEVMRQELMDILAGKPERD